jgi:hypothetical protein
MATPIDDDVELTEEEVEEVEESEEETYIEAVTRDVVSEYDDKIEDYVNDPETPEETATNESIKKFLVQKVRNKLLDSFEEQLKWIEDADLVAMLKKWKKVTAKDDELDGPTAMKRIIKENVSITEAVEQHLEDMMEDVEDADDDDAEDDN